jgi:hypothetical protein
MHKRSEARASADATAGGPNKEDLGAIEAVKGGETKRRGCWASQVRKRAGPPSAIWQSV